MIEELKEFFFYTNQEIKDLFTAILFMAFIFAFVPMNTGFENNFIIFLFSFVVVAISFFIHVSMQKMFAVVRGYIATFRYWLTGLFFSLIVTFVTWGGIPLVLPGVIELEEVERLRLGKFRYGMSYGELAVISFFGPLSNIFIAFFLKPIYLITNSPFVKYMIVINLLLAIFTLLPLPHNAGLNILRNSRVFFYISFFTAVFYSFLIWFATIWTLFIAFVIAVIVCYWLYSKFK